MEIWIDGSGAEGRYQLGLDAVAKGKGEARAEGVCELSPGALPAEEVRK